MSATIAELHNMPATAKSATKFKEYLINLVEAGYKLPEGNSKEGVDITAVTVAIGFSRQVLYPERGAAETISMYRWAIENIGIETILECEVRALNSTMPDIKIIKDMLKKSEKKISTLERLNLELEAHNRCLVKQIQDLNDANAQYESVDTARQNGFEVIIPWLNE